jgi:hypothetical protein
MNDESKKIILARRARFIAAAFASVAAHAQACDDGATAEPCLTFAAGGDTNTGGTGGAAQGGSAGTVVIPPGFGGEESGGEGGAPLPCLAPPE